MTTPVDNIIESFVRDVGAFLDARSLLPPGAAVVVGVSGGADSVALLAALRRLGAMPGRRYRLTAAHLNHALRPDAQADADFVADLAARWGVPCVVGRREVAAEARAAGLGIEQAARAARYEFLTQTAAEAGASHVAVAHHADDNAETVLYRIVRGTHLRGLAGIPAARELGGSGIVLVRPLLERRRPDIEEFCRAEGLSWRADSTNADTSYRRNFIRHELLPLLRSRLNRRADEALLRLAQAATDAEDVLSSLARAAVARASGVARASCPRSSSSSSVASSASVHRAAEEGEEETSEGRMPSGRKGRMPSPLFLDASVLAVEHPLVQAVAIRIVLEDLGVPMRDLDADRLGELRTMLAGAGPTAVVLPGGWTARMDGRTLVVGHECPAPTHGRDPYGQAGHATGNSTPEAVVLECPGRTALADGRQIVCRIEPFDAAAMEAHRKGHAPGTEMLDAGQVRGRLLCRGRQAGDSFVPLGSPGRQSVSDFLTNQKLPAARRERVRCICDELGIVYVAPLRIDERVKVSESTKDVLRLEWGE